MDLQPGNYSNCKLLNIEEGMIGKKSTSAIVMTFDVGGGCRRNVILFMTDAASEFTIETLQKLGWDGKSDPIKLNDDVYDPGIDLYMKIEEWEGKPQERWNISTFKAAPATPDQKQNLRQKFRATYGAPKPASSSALKSAPKRPSVSTEASRVTNQDEAFTFHQKQYSNLSEDEIEKKWWKIIEQHQKESGKKESAFEAEDWKSVAEISALPF